MKIYKKTLGEEQGGGRRSASPASGGRVRYGTQLCNSGLRHRHHCFQHHHRDYYCDYY